MLYPEFKKVEGPLCTTDSGGFGNPPGNLANRENAGDNLKTQRIGI